MHSLTLCDVSRMNGRAALVGLFWCLDSLVLTLVREVRYHVHILANGRRKNIRTPIYSSIDHRTISWNPKALVCLVNLLSPNAGRFPWSSHILLWPFSITLLVIITHHPYGSGVELLLSDHMPFVFENKPNPPLGERRRCSGVKEPTTKSKG